MAHFRIHIDCDGRISQNPRKAEPEIASILLRYVHVLVTVGGLDQVLYDGDGHRAGTAEFNTGDPRRTKYRTHHRSYRKPVHAIE
jgi:hypothetical protein